MVKYGNHDMQNIQSPIFFVAKLQDAAPLEYNINGTGISFGYHHQRFVGQNAAIPLTI